MRISLNDGFSPESMRGEITTIHIPDTVEYINTNAFRDCTALTHVTLGNGIRLIGPGAFANTALTSINIPDSVMVIGDGAFDGIDGPISISFRGMVFNSVDEFLFAFAPPTHNQTEVASSNDNVPQIAASNNMPQQESFDGMQFRIENGEATLIRWMDSGHLVIPEQTLNGHPVTAIGDEAFMHFVPRSLLSIVIPNSVVSIGDRAFFRGFHAEPSSLRLEIPASVVNIGEDAFTNAGEVIFLGQDGNQQLPVFTATTRTSAPPRTARFGEIIEFGTTQHNNPAYWMILDEHDGKLLIILQLSEGNILPARYNQGVLSAGIQRSDAVTWETSSLRQWLNDDFYNSDGFTNEERMRIAHTLVLNNDNPWHGTPGGNDTVDKIFLLSIEETVWYFGDSGQLENRPNLRSIDDEYNIDRRLGLTWWLRSPGSTNVNAAYVYRLGEIVVGGVNASQHSVQARPVMWIYR